MVAPNSAGLIKELGLSYKALGSNDSFELRSIETVYQLDDADVLLVIDFGLTASIITESPLYQGPSIVQEGRVAFLDILPTHAFWGQTTLSVRWVVPHLVEAIEAAAQQ